MRRGFTIVEIMVVIGILSLLILVASVNLRSFQSTSQVSQAAEELASLLRDAQSQSMSVVNGETHGVHFDQANGFYSVFEGSAYDPSDPSNVVYSLDASVELTQVSLAGGGADVIFDKLTGSTSQSGSIVIISTLNGSVSRTIAISNEGKISGE